MSDWRFRVNWRGKLFLQRRVRALQPLGPSMDWVLIWRDATVGDMGEYYRDLMGGKP